MFDDLSVVAENLIDAGDDRAVAVVRMTGRAKVSGIETEIGPARRKDRAGARVHGQGAGPPSRWTTGVAGPRQPQVAAADSYAPADQRDRLPPRGWLRQLGERPEHLAAASEPSPVPLGRPQFVTLLQPVTIQIQYGNVTLPSGSRVQFVSTEGADIRIRYAGTDALIPSSAASVQP